MATLKYRAKITNAQGGRNIIVYAQPDALQEIKALDGVAGVIALETINLCFLVTISPLYDMSEVIKEIEAIGELTPIPEAFIAAAPDAEAVKP